MNAAITTHARFTDIFHLFQFHWYIALLLRLIIEVPYFILCLKLFPRNVPLEDSIFLFKH